MIVVSDTSPINYLILINKISILPDLLGRVLVPAAVFAELRAEAAPAAVRDLISSQPAWLEVRDADHLFDADLDELDIGEREAIILAEQLDADALLIDERHGREVAVKRNLPVIGTLGIIGLAADRGLLDFAASLIELKSVGFYVAPRLEQYFLSRHK